ncbi:MAG: flippase-like domain-containing protein [Bacteroidaceae bacterium]|nr:flippase-like domain-containing protein [Bacteroidaceae bacterium]
MTWTKKRLTNLFFFIGLAAVIIMLLTFDVSFIELWDNICRAGYWFIPIVGVWLIIYALNALAWQAIIRGNARSDQHVSFLRIYRLTISGYALNYATPVGGLGGEPYRIMELSKDVGKQTATSSVIFYAMMHFLAHFWLWFSSIFLYLLLVAIGDLPLNTTLSIILAAIALFCLVAFRVLTQGYRHGVAVRIVRWAGKIPGLHGWSERFYERHSEALQNVDQQIMALHSSDRRAFYTSLLLEYASRIIQASEILFMLLLFGVDCGGGFSGILLTYAHSILILSFTSLFANIIGFLPMQLGVQEGGFVISIAALGLSAALGIFVSIICRVREIIWIFIGIMLMKVSKE